MTRTFPAEYLQPDITKDCTFYATAYLARCLGHPDTTAQDVMAWRAETTRHEDRYIEQSLGIETRSWWADKDDDERRRRWWLGSDGGSANGSTPGGSATPASTVSRP